MVKNLPANAGDVGSIPGWGRSPEEGNGSPLQYSCLGNLMDREACRLQSMGSQRIGHSLATEHQSAYDAQDSPRKRDCPTPNVHSAEVEKPWL